VISIDLRDGLMRRFLMSFATLAIAFVFLSKTTAAPATNEVEIVPQIGHSTKIHSIVFSPNGRLLVTSDSEHAVKLWDAKSGLLLRTLVISDVHTVIFSPDSRFVVSGQSDGTITFWDSATGNPQRRLKDAKYVRGLAFSSDGRTLASMTLDNVQIWDVERGKRRLTLTPPHEIGAMALSADGRSIVAGGEEHSGSRGDAGSRQARQELLDSINEAARDELSANDRAGLFAGLKAAKGDELVKDVALSLWETTSGKLIKAVRIGPSKRKTQQFNVGFLAFAAGGHEIICETEETGESWSDRDLRLRVLDATSGREVRVLASDDTILLVDVSADRRAVAVGGLRAVRLLDPTNGKQLQKLDTKSIVGIFALSPDNQTVAGGADRRPRIWDLATADDVGSAHQLDPLNKMAVTRDGQTIICFGGEKLRLWDAKTGRLLHSFNAESAQADASFSADGTLFAAVAEIKESSGSTTFRLKIFEVATGRELRTLDFGSSHWPTAISLAPDGKSVLLLASSKDPQNRLQLWDAETGKKLRDVAKCTECDVLLAFSPDSQSFITGDNGYNFDGGNYYDGYRLTLWDTKSGDMVKTIDHVDGLFASASAFLPDGHGFALAGVGDPISLRETATLGLLRVTGKKNDAVATSRALAFSPDGRMMVSSGDDQLIRFWDPSGPNLLKASAGHTGQVTSVAVSPDGLTVLSVAKDSTLRRWSRDGSLLATSIAARDGEWLTITPEGFFDASEKGVDMLAVVKGLETLAISQLYQSLYRPDLVREKLAGDPRGLVRQAAANLDLGKVIASGNAPDVRVTLPGRGLNNAANTQITAEAEIIDRGGGVGRVEWKVNGVTAGIDNPGQATGGAPLRLTRSLVLDTGDNRIEVVAYNGANLIASAPGQLNVAAQPTPPVAPAVPSAAPPASVSVAGARLYVLAAGSDNYADKRFRLKYSVPDAKALAQGFEAAGKGFYQSVDVKVMSDTEVVVDKLNAAFEELSKQIQPTDVFVLFLAGHGKTVDGRYYYIPQNFTAGADLSEAAIDVAVKAQGISQEQWQRWFAEIPARKSVIMFDTCESGTLTGDAAETKTLEQGAANNRLAQATGRSIMTASSGSEAAFEGYHGHGLFTYNVLDALNRSDGDRNGTIDMTELAAFVYGQVLAISETEFKQRQEPQIKITLNYPLVRPTDVLKIGEPLVSMNDAPTFQVTDAAKLQVKPEEGATVVRSLSAKTAVTVLKSEGGWSLVASEGKPIGYVATRDLAQVR
jgi:WD40 repeat protein/uncharacterized caspase-like protein